MAQCYGNDGLNHAKLVILLAKRAARKLSVDLTIKLVTTRLTSHKIEAKKTKNGGSALGTANIARQALGSNQGSFQEISLTFPFKLRLKICGMTDIPFAYLMLSYSLGTTVAVYVVLSLLVSAFSTLALNRMVVNKSRSLMQSEESCNSFE